MNIQQNIEAKLTAGLKPQHLEVVNQSDRHNVPPGSESHFKVVLVSESFEGMSLVSQHRMVYELLSEELEDKVHALALHTYAPSSWNSASPESPECLGGKAGERR
jgi:BolA protein